MYKQSNKSKLITALGALGLPVGMDVLQHDDFSLASFDKKRVGNALLNAAIGAGAGHLGAKGKVLEGVSMASLAPAKDLLLNLQDTPNKVNDAMAAVSDSAATSNKLMAGLGIGALGLGVGGGYGTFKLGKHTKCFNEVCKISESYIFFFTKLSIFKPQIFFQLFQILSESIF